MSKIDIGYFESEHTLIGGSDEVGRGPLAGPVVSCSIFVHRLDGTVIEREKFKKVMRLLSLLGVTDSKKLSKEKRHDILETVGVTNFLNKKGQLFLSNPKEYCLSYEISEISHKKIDELNILNASLQSMKLSINKLAKEIGGKGAVLIDGKFIPKNLNRNLESHAIIKGDTKSNLIGMASILAKAYRDTLMEKLAKKYPGYGLDKNAGYPTASHKEAIKTLGITPIHRKTFSGVKEFVESRHN